MFGIGQIKSVSMFTVTILHPITPILKTMKIGSLRMDENWHGYHFIMAKKYYTSYSL